MKIRIKCVPLPRIKLNYQKDIAGDYPRPHLKPRLHGGNHLMVSSCKFAMLYEYFEGKVLDVEGSRYVKV